MKGTWKAYYPEDGEEAGDAIEIKPKAGYRDFGDALVAAQRACEIDFEQRDGWERTQGTSFLIVVINPHGKETRWSARHEPTVEHMVEAANG